MTRLLWNISDHIKTSIADFNGGNLRNAIPREAFATIVLDRTAYAQVKRLVDDFYSTLTDEFGDLEKDLKISIKETNFPGFVMDKESQKKFLEFIILLSSWCNCMVKRNG